MNVCPILGHRFKSHIVIRSNIFPVLQESGNFSSQLSLSDRLPTGVTRQKEEVSSVPHTTLLHCSPETDPWLTGWV